MRTLVISDLHIGSKGCQTEKILEVLERPGFERYILVGDIIDGWLFKKYKKFSYEHTRVIRKFLKLSKNKEIIWISGNHDEFLRKYTPTEIGNIKIVDEWVEDGIWFCHGDEYDGVVKLHWLGMLGSLGYDLAIIIDRWLKKLGYGKSLSKFLKNNSINIPVKFNHVHSPDYLMATVLPKKIRQEKLDSIRLDLSEFNYNELLGHYYDTEDNGKLDYFKYYNAELDKVRNENLEKYFSKLIEAIDE